MFNLITNSVLVFVKGVFLSYIKGAGNLVSGHCTFSVLCPVLSDLQCNVKMSRFGTSQTFVDLHIVLLLVMSAIIMYALQLYPNVLYSLLEF